MSRITVLPFGRKSTWSKSKTYKMEDLRDIPKLDWWVEYKHPEFRAQATGRETIVLTKPN